MVFDLVRALAALAALATLVVLAVLSTAGVAESPRWSARYQPDSSKYLGSSRKLQANVIERAIIVVIEAVIAACCADLQTHKTNCT